jgi:hypothetical protein
MEIARDEDADTEYRVRAAAQVVAADHERLHEKLLSDLRDHEQALIRDLREEVRGLEDAVRERQTDGCGRPQPGPGRRRDRRRVPAREARRPRPRTGFAESRRRKG